MNYLVLVNKENKLPDDYQDNLELVEMENFEGKICKVEKETFLWFEKLQNHLLHQGIKIAVQDAYRSVEEQKHLREDFARRYGTEYALSIVAEPGTSEHHTGLAIDIVIQKNGRWILENDGLLQLEKENQIIGNELPEFGFILRYPKEKEKITGFGYEPWHLRFVGIENAKKMSDRKLSLEEYVGLPKQRNND